MLEAAAGVELALLDKTGTLTSGSPRMTGITVGEDENDFRALQMLQDSSNARTIPMREASSHSPKNAR